MKTLYLGLKMNHPRHVALLHPLAFILRRILFAAIIIFMVNVSLYNILGVFLLLGTCLFMLGFVLSEWQWQSQWISYQHIGNEIGLYVVCVLLLMFTGFCSLAVIWALGWVVVGLLLTIVAFNLVMMLCHSVQHARLMVRRYYARKKAQRSMRKVFTALRAINAMRRAYAAESEWQGQHSERPSFSKTKEQLWCALKVTVHRILIPYISYSQEKLFISQI